MKNLVSFGCFIPGVGMMMTAVAVAKSEPQNAPGYRYGRANCSPFSKPCVGTLRDCRACCLAGKWNMSFRSEDLEDCYAYCASNPWVLPCP